MSFTKNTTPRKNPPGRNAQPDVTQYFSPSSKFQVSSVKIKSEPLPPRNEPSLPATQRFTTFKYPDTSENSFAKKILFPNSIQEPSTPFEKNKISISSSPRNSISSDTAASSISIGYYTASTLSSDWDNNQKSRASSLSNSSISDILTAHNFPPPDTDSLPQAHQPPKYSSSHPDLSFNYQDSLEEFKNDQKNLLYNQDILEKILAKNHPLSKQDKEKIRKIFQPYFTKNQMHYMINIISSEDRKKIKNKFHELFQIEKSILNLSNKDLSKESLKDFFRKYIFKNISNLDVSNTQFQNESPSKRRELINLFNEEKSQRDLQRKSKLLTDSASIINFSENKSLKFIPIDLYRSLRPLQSLNISNTKIDFNREFNDFEQSDYLEKSKEPSEGIFSTLEKINLENTPISKFRFEKNSILKWTDKFFRKTIYTPPQNLQELNLSSCKNLSDISGIQQTPKLKKLFLKSFKRIHSSWRHIFKLTELKELDISKNSLKNLPENFSELDHLESLNLRDNLLKKLPPSFSKLKNLKELDISKNPIKVLPENFSELDHLESLNINDTLLNTLPSCISKLKNLKKLDVSKNLIKVLPENFSELDHLESLNINDTLLNTLPSCIKAEFMDPKEPVRGLKFMIIKNDGTEKPLDLQWSNTSLYKNWQRLSKQISSSKIEAVNKYLHGD